MARSRNKYGGRAQRSLYAAPRSGPRPDLSDGLRDELYSSRFRTVYLVPDSVRDMVSDATAVPGLYPARPLRIMTGFRFSPRAGPPSPRGGERSRGVAVRVPSRALFCVRRKQRRSVLFATRRAGAGQRKPHGKYFRSASSYYSC